MQKQAKAKRDGAINPQNYNKRKPQIGHDQESGGVSVLIWLAAPVETRLMICNEVQLGHKATSEFYV